MRIDPEGELSEGACLGLEVQDGAAWREKKVADVVLVAVAGINEDVRRTGAGRRRGEWETPLKRGGGGGAPC